MAALKRAHVCGKEESEPETKAAKINLDAVVDRVIKSKEDANDVFVILEALQSEKEDDVISAIDASEKLFTALLEKEKSLFLGKLPEKEEVFGEEGSDLKYSIFLRHRYNDCVEILSEHLNHKVDQVKESALCCLMKFAVNEGNHPLEDLDWSEHYSFPKELIQIIVDKLLSQSTENLSLIISRFQEYLEMDDVRYYVMTSIRVNVAKVMDQNDGHVLPIYQQNTFALLSSIEMPSEELDLSKFMVKQEAKHEGWKAAKLAEHQRNFERMWLGFLKHKLHRSMYKKILLILHDSILPHMKEPTLMLDFLTSAYDVGGATSLLALNGLFVLMHQYNLDYPDFYNKLYNLLDAYVFHVKYKARFFHLADIFLSSSHLPIYLVAAFAKRLARLALTAPTPDLFVVLPFIYNLICRHPSCRVLIHRPDNENKPMKDPFKMEEKDPAQCRALESSLWEIKDLQSHYHPDVSKTAKLINKPLSEQEDDINEMLGITTLELMERDLKMVEEKDIPLEYETPTGFFKTNGDILGQFFELR